MRIAAIIVTYGDRSGFLITTIKRLIVQHIDKIFVVDNGSQISSHDIIRSFTKRYKKKIILFSQNENLGSAKGFQLGIIKAARFKSFDYILLLDDDNLLELDGIRKLRKISIARKTILACLRQDRPKYLEALRRSDPYLVLPAKNSYLGFSILSIPIFLKERFFTVDNELNDAVNSKLKMVAAPYGGLFFHRSISKYAKQIDTSFFVYMDDLDFTYKLHKNGFNIILNANISIKDLETSYYISGGKKNILYHTFIDSKGKFLGFQIRNMIKFQRRYLITNSYIYLINKFVFFLLISVISIIRFKFRRLLFIYKTTRNV